MAKGRAERMKRPNRIIYALGRMVLTLYFCFGYHFRVKRHKMEGIKPPFVVVANHASSMDFALVMLAIKGFRLHVVTATVFYYSHLLRHLLKWMACVPKLQMVADPVSVRQMLQVVKNGGALSLFPQGQVSYDGRDLPMPKGTGKLIKYMKAPVIFVRLQGAYLTKPKWAKKPRHGRIFADVSVLLTPQQLSSMSFEQIDETIGRAMAFNDYDFVRERHIPYTSGNRAERLENLLYQCPRCHALYRMQSRGDTIRCLNCQNGARMDEYGLLHPLHKGDVIFDDPVQWTAFEREMARRHLLEKGQLQQSAKLYVADDKRPRFKQHGSGTVTVTRDELRFDGEKDGKPFSLCMQSKLIAALPFSFKKTYWEVPGAREYYRMVPKQSGSLLHMVIMLEAAHALQNQETQS